MSANDVEENMSESPLPTTSISSQGERNPAANPHVINLLQPVCTHAFYIHFFVLFYLAGLQRSTCIQIDSINSSVLQHFGEVLHFIVILWSNECRRCFNSWDIMATFDKSGLKLPQKSREKSLLPPAGLGRSEILAGRSEILAVAETRRELPRQLLLDCLYLSPIYLFLSLYIQCCVLFKFFIFNSTFGVQYSTVLELSLFSNILP